MGKQGVQIERRNRGPARILAYLLCMRNSVDSFSNPNARPEWSCRNDKFSLLGKIQSSGIFKSNTICKESAQCSRVCKQSEQSRSHQSNVTIIMNVARSNATMWHGSYIFRGAPYSRAVSGVLRLIE